MKKLITILAVIIITCQSVFAQGGLLTVGAVYGLVQSSLNKVKNEIIPLLDGKIKEDMTLLYQDGNKLIQQVDEKMQMKLNYTFEQLNKTERQTMEDLEAIVKQIINKIPTSDQLKEIIGEAQITSYEFINSIPLKEKIPLLVYIKNNDFKIGQETSNEITIRGAFLAFKTNYQIKVGNATIIPKMISNNEILLEIPNSMLDTIAKPESLIIKASPFKKLPNFLFIKNRIKKNVEQSIALKVTPVTTYKVIYSIQGTGYKKVTINETKDPVVVDKDSRAGWTMPQCLSDNRYTLKSWGHPQFFPNNDPMTLTSCGQDGTCVNICGNAKNGRAQFQISLVGERWDWVAMPVFNSDTIKIVNQKNAILPYGQRDSYIGNTDYNSFNMNYTIRIFRQVGKLQPTREDLGTGNSAGGNYSTYLDSPSLNLTLEINE